MNDAFSKGDQARQEIMLAARRLFLSNGYHGTSMRAIARDAGDRAVAGLYNHFPTKEAIFAALIEEQSPYEELFGILGATVADARSAPEFVRRALGVVMDVMPRHYDYLQLIQIDVREFEGRTLQRLLETQVLPRVTALVERIAALPGMQPIHPLVLMRLMASLALGYIFTDRMAERTVFKQIPRAAWADHFADALLYGLADPAFRPDQGAEHS